MSGFQGFKLKQPEKKSTNATVPPPSAKMPVAAVPTIMPKHFGNTFSTKYKCEDE